MYNITSFRIPRNIKNASPTLICFFDYNKWINHNLSWITYRSAFYRELTYITHVRTLAHRVAFQNSIGIIPLGAADRMQRSRCILVSTSRWWAIARTASKTERSSRKSYINRVESPNQKGRKILNAILAQIRSPKNVSVFAQFSFCPIINGAHYLRPKLYSAGKLCHHKKKSKKGNSFLASRDTVFDNRIASQKCFVFRRCTVNTIRFSYKIVCWTENIKIVKRMIVNCNL